MENERIFRAISRIDAPADTVFRWHEEPGALERLTPSWQPVEIEQRPQGIRDGDRAVLRVGVGPLKIRWVLEHRDYVEAASFATSKFQGRSEVGSIPIHSHRTFLERASSRTLSSTSCRWDGLAFFSVTGSFNEN
jgi:ligand-binding SRPBCC domain-containing protein